MWGSVTIFGYLWWPALDGHLSGTLVYDSILLQIPATVVVLTMVSQLVQDLVHPKYCEKLQGDTSHILPFTRTKLTVTVSRDGISTKHGRSFFRFSFPQGRIKKHMGPKMGFGTPFRLSFPQEASPKHFRWEAAWAFLSGSACAPFAVSLKR